jgi:hypothetical protein
MRVSVKVTRVSEDRIGELHKGSSVLVAHYRLTRPTRFGNSIVAYVRGRVFEVNRSRSRSSVRGQSFEVEVECSRSIVRGRGRVFEVNRSRSRNLVSQVS